MQIRSRKKLAAIEASCGSWSNEHVFALNQALQSWDHHQKLIANRDKRIAAVPPPYDETRPPLSKTTKRGGVNAPDIAKLREILAQMSGGQDLTQRPTLTHYDVLQLIGEVGTNLGIWPCDKHFTAWMWVFRPIVTGHIGASDGSRAWQQRHKGRVKRRCNQSGRLFACWRKSLVRSKKSP